MHPLYIVAYDIREPKRLAKVRKVAYAYAFGGQKSALESYLSKKLLDELVIKLRPLIKDEDRINIIKVAAKDNIMLGIAKQLPFDKGTILL